MDARCKGRWPGGAGPERCTSWMANSLSPAGDPRRVFFAPTQRRAEEKVVDARQRRGYASSMATKSSPRKGAPAGTPEPIVEINIHPYLRGSEAVSFRDPATRKALTTTETINRVCSRLSLTAAQLGEAIGQSKRTVQNWRSGRPMSVEAALALKHYLSPRQMGFMLAEVSASQVSAPTLASNKAPKSPTKATKRASSKATTKTKPAKRKK